MIRTWAVAGPACNYDLRYQRSGTADWIDGPLGVSALTAEIGDLTPVARYHVRMPAPNGDGAWSAAGTGMTSQSVTPVSAALAAGLALR